MKKLTLAMFLMSIILLFIGCKKMNGELSDADSLQTNIDTISLALTDSSLQVTSDSLNAESEITNSMLGQINSDVTSSLGDGNVSMTSLTDMKSSMGLLSTAEIESRPGNR
jgi:hypothetical protein